jgi:hypothetical protein
MLMKDNRHKIADSLRVDSRSRYFQWTADNTQETVDSGQQTQRIDKRHMKKAHGQRTTDAGKMYRLLVGLGHR